MATGKQAIKPSVSVARLLLKRRRDLGLSLRQAQERTEEWGQVIPFTTIGKIERGQVEPGFVRLNVLLKVYDLPPQMAHELLELEQFAARGSGERLPSTLYEEGIKHWKAGNLREGLACLLALRTRVPGDAATSFERQKSILSFAIAAGSLGRNRLSRQIVDELLLEPPEDELLVPVLIQAAVCWRRLGSGEAALGFLSRAAAHVASDDHRSRAWVHHERSSTYRSMGHIDEARAELARTISAYRAAGDAYGEGRALCARVDIKLETGDANGALRAARVACTFADQHGFGRLKIVGTINEGRALIQLDEHGDGLSALRAALAASISTEDRVAQFYVHFYLWKAHEALGEEAHAKHELQNAQYYVNFTDEATPETNEIRASIAASGNRKKR